MEYESFHSETGSQYAHHARLLCFPRLEWRRELRLHPQHMEALRPIVKLSAGMRTLAQIKIFLCAGALCAGGKLRWHMSAVPHLQVEWHFKKLCNKYFVFHLLHSTHYLQSLRSVFQQLPLGRSGLSGSLLSPKPLVMMDVSLFILKQVKKIPWVSD